MPPKTCKAAVGLYLSGIGLESLLEDLSSVGFRNEDVCVVLPQSHSAAPNLLAARSPMAQEDSRATSDWFAQFGAVVIPGVGTFVAGREFVSILFDPGSGAMKCDNALHGLGLPPEQIERYQGWIRGGGVIVYVCCKTDDYVHHAIEVLEEAGAEEVSRLDTPGRRPKLTVVPLLKVS